MSSESELPPSGFSCTAITARSLLFGFLGILLVSFGASYHHAICGGNGAFLISNHMPPVVFGYLMAVAVGWNGVMGRLKRTWALTPRELLVVMIMTLVACFPAFAGLYRYLLRIIMNPWHFLLGQPDWSHFGLLEQQLSPRLFPQPVPHRDAAGVLMMDERVYRGFFSGLANGERWVGFSQVPWAAWLPALAYWGPLVGTLSLAVVAMTFLVHRQWTEHEQLSYPIAQVASCFWKREDGARGVPDLFRDRLFWIGFVPLFALYMLEFANNWFPQSLPSLEALLPNFKRWWVPLLETFPILRKVPGGGSLAGQRISFAIVGLAYFVSTDISLTMGLSQAFLVVVGLVFFGSVGTPLTQVDVDVTRAGSYLGYTLILAYTGRTYFSGIFRKAFLRPREASREDAVAVLAARVLVLSFAGFVLVLKWMGCDVPMAFFFALATLMLFLVFTRVICETGIPFLQANWFPPKLLTALVGPAAIGQRSLALLTWINAGLLMDPRECLMPYVATSARMASEARLATRRVFWLVVGSLAIALVLAYACNLWVAYSVGSLRDPWAGNNVPKSTFGELAKAFSLLQSTGQLDALPPAHGLARLRLAHLDPATVRFFVTGVLLVIGCSLIRFRFARFPVHPVLFIAWGTWPASISWGAYLIGWFIKTLVVRLGGGRAYQRLKPAFIGIIAAELIAVCVVVAVDLLYYWTTGKPSGIWTFIQAN